MLVNWTLKWWLMTINAVTNWVINIDERRLSDEIQFVESKKTLSKWRQRSQWQHQHWERGERELFFFQPFFLLTVLKSYVVLHRFKTFLNVKWPMFLELSTYKLIGKINITPLANTSSLMRNNYEFWHWIEGWRSMLLYWIGLRYLALYGLALRTFLFIARAGTV